MEVLGGRAVLPDLTGSSFLWQGFKLHRLQTPPGPLGALVGGYSDADWLFSEALGSDGVPLGKVSQCSAGLQKASVRRHPRVLRPTGLPEPLRR